MCRCSRRHAARRRPEWCFLESAVASMIQRVSLPQWVVMSDNVETTAVLWPLPRKWSFYEWNGMIAAISHAASQTWLLYPTWDLHFHFVEVLFRVPLLWKSFTRYSTLASDVHDVRPLPGYPAFRVKWWSPMHLTASEQWYVSFVSSEDNSLKGAKSVLFFSLHSVTTRLSSPKQRDRW